MFEDTAAAGRALMNLAFIRSQTGELEKSLAALQEAVALLDPERHPDLACYARQNLASLLCEAGEPQQAARLLKESQGLFEPYFRRNEGTKFSLELRWLEGRIARGVEDFAAAETALREAAEGFVALEVGYDAALAYLDLAETYLAQGKLDEVGHLAAAVEPVLKANDLAKEAVAALALFREAAVEKHLTATVLDRIRGRVRRARVPGEGDGC